MSLWAGPDAPSQVLPLSAARYTTFAHHHVPYSVIFVVDVIYLSNGLFNVLLFSITRPFLLPHDPPNLNSGSESEDMHEIPQIHEPVYDRAQTGAVLPLPRHESPTNYLVPQPAGGSEGSTMRWSAALSYDTDGKSPSERSFGQWPDGV